MGREPGAQRDLRAGVAAGLRYAAELPRGRPRRVLRRPRRRGEDHRGPAPADPARHRMAPLPTLTRARAPPRPRLRSTPPPPSTPSPALAPTPPSGAQCAPAATGFTSMPRLLNCVARPVLSPALLMASSG